MKYTAKDSKIALDATIGMTMGGINTAHAVNKNIISTRVKGFLLGNPATKPYIGWTNIAGSYLVKIKNDSILITTCSPMITVATLEDFLSPSKFNVPIPTKYVSDIEGDIYCLEVKGNTLQALISVLWGLRGGQYRDLTSEILHYGQLAQYLQQIGQTNQIFNQHLNQQQGQNIPGNFLQ